VIVPPELAYGKKGVQEIPPNATIEVTKLNGLKFLLASKVVFIYVIFLLQLDIELLSIKQSPFGYVKSIN
jgi:hypothetical protein